MSEVEETIKRIQANKGVIGIIVVSQEGLEVSSFGSHINTLESKIQSLLACVSHNVIHNVYCTMCITQCNTRCVLHK